MSSEPCSPRSSAEIVERTTEALLRILNSHNSRHPSLEKEISSRLSSRVSHDEGRTTNYVHSSALRADLDHSAYLANSSRRRTRRQSSSDEEKADINLSIEIDLPRQGERQKPGVSMRTAAASKAASAIANAHVLRAGRRSVDSLQLAQAPDSRNQPFAVRHNQAIPFCGVGNTKPKATTSARNERDHDFLRSIAPLPLSNSGSSLSQRSTQDGSCHSTRGATTNSVGRACNVQAEERTPARRRRLWERLAGCLGAGQD
jgi:hypothetical protein